MVFLWQWKKPGLSTQESWVRPSIVFFTLARPLSSPSLHFLIWKVGKHHLLRLLKGSKEVVDVKAVCKSKALGRYYHSYWSWLLTTHFQGFHEAWEMIAWKLDESPRGWWAANSEHISETREHPRPGILIRQGSHRATTLPPFKCKVLISGKTRENIQEGNLLSSVWIRAAVGTLEMKAIHGVLFLKHVDQDCISLADGTAQRPGPTWAGWRLVLPLGKYLLEAFILFHRCIFRGKREFHTKWKQSVFLTDR